MWGPPGPFADGDDPTRVFTGERKPTDYRLGKPQRPRWLFPVRGAEVEGSVGSTAQADSASGDPSIATGLWPTPEKPFLNPAIHGKIDKGDYTIEKVYFASMPGHYVCGNLYRPVIESHKPQKLPVCCYRHTDIAPTAGFTDDQENVAKAISMPAANPT